VIGTPPAIRPRRPLALVAAAALCLVAVLALTAAPALAARPRIVKPQPDALVVKPHGTLKVRVATTKGKGGRPRAEIDGQPVATRFQRAGKDWGATLSVAHLGIGGHTLTTLNAGGTDTTRFFVGRRAPGSVTFTWHTGWRERGTKLIVVKTKKRLSKDAGYPKVLLNGKRVDKNVHYSELGHGFVGGFGPNVGLRYGRNHVQVKVLLEGGAFATAKRTFVVHRDRPLAGAGPDRRTSVGEPVTLDGRSTQISSQLLPLIPVPKATVSTTGGPAATASDATLTALEPVPAEFEWKVINGPPGPEPVIEEGGSEEPIFIPEVPGTYEIEELVKPEGGGPTGVDTVTIHTPQTTAPMGIPIQTITNSGAIQIGEETYARTSPGVKMMVLSGTELKPIAWPGRWGAAEQTFTAEPNGEWESPPDEKGKNKGQLVEEVKQISKQQTVILTGQGTQLAASALSKSQLAHLEEAIKMIGGTVAHTGQTPLGAADLENGDWSVIGYLNLTEGHGNQDFGLSQEPLPTGTTFEFPKFPTNAGSAGSLNGFMQRIGTLAYDFVSPEFLSLDTKWTPSPSQAPSPTQNTIAVGSNHYASATIPDGAIAMQLLVLDGSEPTKVLENSTYTILNSGCGTVNGPGGIEALDQALHDLATEGGAAGAPGGSNIVIAQDFGKQLGECWPGGNNTNWLQDAIPSVSGNGSGWNGSTFPTKRSELTAMWNNPNVHGYGSVAGNFGLFAGTTAHDEVANYRRPFWDDELRQRVNRDYGGLTLVASTNLYQPSAAFFQGQGESISAANPSVPTIGNGTVTGVLRRNEQSQWELQSSSSLTGATDKAGKFMSFEQASLLELMFAKPTPWPCSVESPAPCKGTKAEIEAAQRYFVKVLAPESTATTVRDLYANEYNREVLSETTALHPYPSKREQIILGGGEFTESLYTTMQKGEPEATWQGISGEIHDLTQVAKGIHGWRQVFEGGSASSVSIAQAGEEVITEVNKVYDKLKKDNKEEEMNGAIAASFLDMVSYLVDIGVAASGNPEAIPVVAPTIGALGAMIDVGDDAADIYSIYGESGDTEVPNNTEAIRGKVTSLSTEVATRYLHIAQTMGHFGSILVDDPEKLRIAGAHFGGEGIWALPESEEVTLKQAMVTAVQRSVFETTLPMAFVQWVTSPGHTGKNGLGALEMPESWTYYCPNTKGGGSRNPWPTPPWKQKHPKKGEVSATWSMEQLGWSGGGPTAGTNMTPQNSQNYDVRGLKSALDDMHPERTETEGIEQEGEPGLGHSGTMASPSLMKKIFSQPNPHVFTLNPEGLGVSKEEVFGLEDFTTRKLGCGEPIG
jgi:hypothetical protein